MSLVSNQLPTNEVEQAGSTHFETDADGGSSDNAQGDTFVAHPLHQEDLVPTASSTDNQRRDTQQEMIPSSRPPRFGVTAKSEKRRRRVEAKKNQRADRKLVAARQENLAISIEQLADWVLEERLAPTAASRSGVQKAMHEIGKWVNKLDPSLLRSNQVSTKSRVALSLVTGRKAASDYRKGRINAEVIFNQLGALEQASEELRQLYNPGKKKKIRKRRRGQSVMAKALSLDVGGKRTAEETLSDIQRYVSQYCKRPPPTELGHLEDQLGRLLGCRNVTKKRLANGRLNVGNNEKHQSLSGMMVDVVYAAVYELLDKHADVPITANNDDFFASRRRYHLSRAHRTGEEHHQRS